MQPEWDVSRAMGFLADQYDAGYVGYIRMIIIICYCSAGLSETQSPFSELVVFIFQSPPVPWRSILKSAPFWAILVAHMGQNYGYETLMTELPTFMKQVLHFNIKAVSI